MSAHQFSDGEDTISNVPYNLVFNVDTRDIILLPAPMFDSIARAGYKIMPDDIIAYRNNYAAAEEEPQE